MTERSVATKEEMEQMRLDAMNTFMKENAGKTIEVPVNLLYALSQFLNATGNMLDEGRQPYPSMEWSCNALGYLLKKKFLNFRDRIPGTLYTVYDTIHEVNTRNERDIDIDELMKWFETGIKDSIGFDQDKIEADLKEDEIEIKYSNNEVTVEDIFNSFKEK